MNEYYDICRDKYDVNILYDRLGDHIKEYIHSINHYGGHTKNSYSNSLILSANLTTDFFIIDIERKWEHCQLNLTKQYYDLIFCFGLYEHYKEFSWLYCWFSDDPDFCNLIIKDQTGFYKQFKIDWIINKKKHVYSHKHEEIVLYPNKRSNRIKSYEIDKHNWRNSIAGKKSIYEKL